MWGGHSKKMAIYKPKMEDSPGSRSALILDFPEVWNVSCLSHLVYAILLEQPEQTNTGRWVGKGWLIAT